MSVLNYLETVATGVNNRIYSDRLVCLSLKRVLMKQVEVHIRGQRPTGVLKSNPGPFAQTEFPGIVAVYDRWSKPESCSN
jgi:hypothetical protein